LKQALQVQLEEFRSFVNDVAMFIRYFSGAIAKSVPHIYLSALPFAPTDSLVSLQYSSSFPQILHLERGQLYHWPSSELVISAPGGPVKSIAISPDGMCIASGSQDGTICVWNTTTGEIVAGPFTDHTGVVWSVAFSPDGKHVISGSEDGTICVWDATTGEMVAGQITGHIGEVITVGFSQDGQHCYGRSTVVSDLDGWGFVLNV
jgi:WD40 repeat protein